MQQACAHTPGRVGKKGLVRKRTEWLSGKPKKDANVVNNAPSVCAYAGAGG